MRLKTQLHDWYIKGHQLQRCYIEDWETIKGVFTDLKLELNEHGPIMTINELHNVKTAMQLTDSIKYEFPEYRPKDIFIALLRAYPAYCRKVGITHFRRQIPHLLHDIMGIRGTIKETEKDFERIIDRQIKEEFNEKPNNIARSHINISFRK